MRILTIIFLLLTAKMLHAQPYYFKHYQVEQGLSNNSVFANVQDHNGFMWFGTKDGLNRFDGYTFKTYRHNPSSPGSLGTDKIYALLSDKKAGLWVGTDHGLYFYNPLNDTFKPIKETLNIGINRIQIDHEGCIWILSGGRIYTYHTQKRIFSVVRMEDSFYASTIYCRPNGEVIITRPEGIAIFNKANQAFETKYIFDKKNKSGIGWISAIHETADQQLIIGTTNQGIKLFNLKTHELKDLALHNKDKTYIFVRDIEVLNDHEFWIGTESGLYIYNHYTGKITHLQKQYGNPYSLSDNAVYALCKDKENGIWIGTYFGGVSYYAAQASVFTKYFPRQHDNSISGSDVREICKDNDGNFWIGTEDAGLNKLNPATGHFSSFLPDGSQSSIAHSNIHALLVDENNLWIGPFEHGIDVMDIRTGLIKKHYHAGVGNSLRSNFVLRLYKTRAGDMLVATTVGLYKYDPKKDDFIPVPGLPFFFYNNIMEDSEGTIWAGTYSDGLFSFKMGNKNYKNYRHKVTDKRSLANNTVNDIFEDSKKNIWIATDGGGLSLLNKDHLTFKSFTVNDGFPNNFLFRILEDDNHKLWISSSRGLIHFNPSDQKIRVYTKADGLLTDQFNYNSGYKDTNGRIYFGSLKGMVSFMPEQLNTTAKTASVFLTGFQIDNTGQTTEKDSLLNQSILYTKQIVLNHNQSSFSIDFAALSYFSPEMTEYAYKMTGLYTNWEYLKTNRKVYFTKLAPGNYVFEAKAMISGSSEWSKNNVKLHITILPPFWKTNLAFLFYTLLLIGLVAYIVWIYHKKIELKNKRRMQLFEHQKEKEIYQAKIEFFTNVAHEIRTPLTLIKGPMEKIIKYAKEVPLIEKNLKTMNRNTDRLLDLTNQLLDFRKTEIHGFSLNFVKANVSELLQDIALQFQFAAESKNISYQTILPEEPLYAYVDVEALYKIMSNLVDNALKYGNATVKVVLSVNKELDQFEIRIVNDGNKIPAELKDKIFEPFFRAKEVEIKQGTGIGLSISRSLTELHNGYLYLEESNTNYNIFIASFPIHQTMEFNLDGKWKKI